MTILIQHFSHYIKQIQKYGLRESIHKAWGKLVSYTQLEFRAFRASLDAKFSMSDLAILNHTTEKWNTVDDLVHHICNKETPALLFSERDKETYITLIKKRYPTQFQETLRRADNFCSHRFRFLGSDFEFQNHINWHFDPSSGNSWPNDYFEKIEKWLWTEKRLWDFKMPWELNRHQYFVTLGKAYWLTGDERYANEFTSQILSWINDNPRGFGINWYSSLEIGVRLISWAWAFHFFRSSSDFTAQAGKQFLKSVYQQTIFLHNHLTINEKVRNNHIIGEAAGLIFIGSLFPEFREASDWLSTGLQIFEQELNQQTFSDGANKEQATSYHRFVLDFLLLIVLLGRRGAIPVSTQLEDIFEKMLNYTMFTTMPHGDSLVIGDADDGRGFIFEESADFWDFRNWLAVGSVLYKRSDFKFVAQDFGEEAFWLLGSQGLHIFEQLENIPPRETSFSFLQAGHFVIRDNWDTDSDIAFFKSGPFGWGGDGFCAHSHCDLLTFILGIKGTPVIVDSGTYTYHGPWREHFRLTNAHNALIIDGNEQAIPFPNFNWQKVSQAECLVWEDKRVMGVMQTVPGVRHQRELSHPKIGIWEITDNLQGKGVHNLSWFFHIEPELCLRWSSDRKSLLLEKHGEPFVIVLPPPNVKAYIESGWYSSRYGKKVPNPLLRAFWEGEIPSNSVNFCWTFQNIN